MKRDRTGEHLSATDLSDGKPVVVRLFPISAISPGALLRLEYEAKILGEVKSPSIGPISHISRDAEWFAVVRPFVPGIALRERLLKAKLEFRETIALGRCIFSALKSVHERGVFHHNIRPTNIILDDGVPLGTAVLIDFSLGSHFISEDMTGEEALETAIYLSPESSGALNYDIGETSDLYSAGIVLFECLAGQPPFRGDKAGTILFQHMTASAPELRSMGVDLPPALEEVIQRLLRKDPRDRYQTAEAVLMDLEAIDESLRGGTEIAHVVGSRDRRPTLAEPALVGREAELNRIEEQMRLVLSGHSRLVYLEAESGGGKTRLLEEIVRRGAKAGMWVLRGQGMEMAGQQPFQIFNGIVEQVAAKARADRAFADALKNRLGEHLDAVGAALPELARLLDWKTTGISGPEAFAENRTIQALAALLSALEAADRPVLIILDDCQWADELTCKLIRWRQAQSNAEPCRVMLIAAFRSEEVAEDHLLRGIEPSVDICLPVLAAAEIGQLLESMAGRLPEVAVNLIAQFAEGNPFMASAVLRSLVESGALIAESDGWRVEPSAMADLSSSSQAAAFLARRMDLLPAETIRLLSTGAILGKEFDLDTAAKLSGHPSSQAVAAIEEARQRHLVWGRSDGSKWIFVHDKIRSALLDRVTAERRREIHRGAALHLRQNAPHRASDISYHFDAADDSRSALPYAIQAAEQARAQYALEIAEQQYRIALRGDSSADRAERFRIAEGLGDVLMLRGNYGSAGELFESAAGFAQSATARAQICGKIGELALKRGDMGSAARALEEALRLLGKAIPQIFWLCCAMLIWQFLIYLTHSFASVWFKHGKRKIPELEDTLRMRLLAKLGYTYWYSRGKVQAFLVHFLGMNLAERHAPTVEMAQIYAEHAVAMTLFGWYRRGIAFAEKSLDIRKTLGDAWGQGQSLSFYGVVFYAASRFPECIAKCREAVRLLERTGDRWEEHIARYQIAAALYRMGDLKNALEEARRLHESGREMGDELASGISLDVWALASGGDVPREVLKREVEKKRTDAQTAAQVLLAQAVQLIEAGNAREAGSALEKALAESKRLGLMNAYVAPVLSWLATALRIQAGSPMIRSASRRAALLAKAEAVARRAVRVARRLRNDLPRALREYALILAMSGKTGSVRSLLDASLAEAKKQDAKFEYAQTLLVHGELGLEWGWPDAESSFANAQTLLMRSRISSRANEGEHANRAKTASLSLYDRFDTVLEAGRKIASALTREAIFEETRGAAVRLLRAERCLVLEIRQDADDFRFLPVAGGIEGTIDEMLARKALQTGRAVIRDEESPRQSGNRPGSGAKQSTLCVPLYVRGRAVACLYVVHRHIQKLFGPDEERLADFIAAIAGAALENAEGFKLLQQLNATLEQRVVERTASAEARARELTLSNRELERVASELLKTQEQLRVAMQAANDANLAKSRFLATMSHEIRTPMNGIIGMTELALSTSLTGQQRNYLTTLKDSAGLLLEIISDILDFSKIESGKMELETIPCDIRKVVEDVARLLAVSAAKKNLELVCRIAANVPAEVLGDPKRLRQVIVNLVGNAIKFTESGEVLVRVNVEDAAEGKTRLRFSVQDTGIGIPADKTEHIFEAFRQSDSSVTRRFGGTGLGLAISAQLVELMGGRIGVESELGRGSTFHFSSSFAIPPISESPSAAPHFENCLALIVSGNQNVRENCGEILANAGMRVQTEQDRDAALQALAAIRANDPESNAPALLVIDAGTNRGAGFEFLESFGAGERAGWRIIVLTPAGSMGGFERFQKSGIRQCIQKPVIGSELLDAAQATLKPLPAEPLALPSIPQRKNSVLHVLVADDSSVNREVTSGLLELRGHAVQIAGNGREAVEAFQRQTFDVILMDVEMPEIDGLTAARMIRDLEKDANRRVPILAMTAHVLNSIKEQCLEAGMDGYISKPIQPEYLYRALESYCPHPVSEQSCR
ncbi:MAG: response regulator [Pirellulales bacterium]|nr:response regulator [Pirellulales bacterium]